MDRERFEEFDDAFAIGRRGGRHGDEHLARLRVAQQRRQRPRRVDVDAIDRAPLQQRIVVEKCDRHAIAVLQQRAREFDAAHAGAIDDDRCLRAKTLRQPVEVAAYAETRAADVRERKQPENDRHGTREAGKRRHVRNQTDPEGRDRDTLHHREHRVVTHVANDLPIQSEAQKHRQTDDDACDERRPELHDARAKSHPAAVPVQTTMPPAASPRRPRPRSVASCAATGARSCRLQLQEVSTSRWRSVFSPTGAHSHTRDENRRHCDGEPTETIARECH